MVIILPEKWDHIAHLIDYGASTVHVPALVGRKNRHYCQYPDVAVQLSFAVVIVDVGGAPIVAYFSGRGPSVNNPFIIKPDILALGLNNLA